jgi:hypothetical protein
MMLENPENLLILANRGSDKRNLHRVVRIPAKPYIPRVWMGECKWERRIVYGNVRRTFEISKKT